MPNVATARAALDRPAVRFLVAGGLNTVLGFLLFRGALHLLGDRPGLAWAAQSASYAVCIVISYVVNHAWTFRSGGPHGRQIPRFVTAHLGSLVLSSALIQAGVTRLHLPVLACWTFAVGVTTVTNFVLQRFWVFARPATPVAL